MQLSIMPPVLPMRKQPGLIPPTVAGPITTTSFSRASFTSSRVLFSGTPYKALAEIIAETDADRDLAEISACISGVSRRHLGDDRDRGELLEAERLLNRRVHRALRRQAIKSVPSSQLLTT